MRHRNQRGVTLVELMIAMVIGLFLLAGLLQLYSSNKQTFRTQVGVSRLQESARFVVDALARDLRMADVAGCRSFNFYTAPTGEGGNIYNNLRYPEGQTTYPLPWNIFDSATPTVTAHQYTGTGTAAGDWTPAIPSELNIQSQLLAGSEVVTIKRISDNVTVVNELYTQGDLTLKVAAGDVTFQTGDFIVVTNCTKASVAQVTNVVATADTQTLSLAVDNTFTPGNTEQGLATGFEVGALAARLVTHTYFISNQAIPTLSMAELQFNAATKVSSMTSFPIVEGIENFRLSYGLDTDADEVSDKFVEAKDLGTDGRNIKSIRVRFTASTVNSIGSDKDYVDGAGNVVNADGILRRYFTTSINLRNRVPIVTTEGS